MPANHQNTEEGEETRLSCCEGQQPIRVSASSTSRNAPVRHGLLTEFSASCGFALLVTPRSAPFFARFPIKKTIVFYESHTCRTLARPFPPLCNPSQTLEPQSPFSCLSVTRKKSEQEPSHVGDSRKKTPKNSSPDCRRKHWVRAR